MDLSDEVVLDLFQDPRNWITRGIGEFQPLVVCQDHVFQLGDENCKILSGIHVGSEQKIRWKAGREEKSQVREEHDMLVLHRMCTVI